MEGENKKEHLNFDEFIELMQAIEKKILQNERELQRDVDDSESIPNSASEEQKAKYGSMLPRTGVHFLPDTKVIDILK